MRRFLLSISLMLVAYCATAACEQPCFPEEEGESRQYAVLLQFGKVSLTGICIMKHVDGVIAGTMINEFGIRAFDFSFDREDNRVKLSNIIGFLDRWYIRKTIRRDMTLLLGYGNDELPVEVRRHIIEQREDQSIVMTNSEGNITYRFTPIAK